MRRGDSGINMLVGVDKPVGMSSHDVVNRVRRILGERRVGHAGTLDPLASGVMVLGVGQATRLLGIATSETKRYLGRFVFGSETTTDDAEGEARVVRPAPSSVGDEAFANASMGLLLAMETQMPPMFSAISVDGRRAYDAARKGEQVQLQPRPIRVLEAHLVGLGTQDETGEAYWDVAVTVSKGTYVRALARDLGRSLESACHLGGLRRLASGPVRLAQCLTIEQLQDAVDRDALPQPLDPVEVAGLGSVEVAAGMLRDVCDGKTLKVAPDKAVVDAGTGDIAIVCEGRLYALARVRNGGLAPHTVFKDGIIGVVGGRTNA